MGTMKRRSFRWRLALLSMGLSGLVLIVFGSATWFVLEQSRLRNLDNELRVFGYRFASRSSRNVSGTRQEETLLELVGSEVEPYRFFSILDREGQRLHETARWPEGLDPTLFPAGSDPMNPQPEVAPPPPLKSGDLRQEREPRTVLETTFYTVKHLGRRYRVGVFANPEVAMVYGGDLDQFSQDLDQLRHAFLFALPAALAMIALGAWWLARKALRPIEALGEDMAQVSARALDQRLDAGTADLEFARIIEIYNAMLERLERSFHQATRFSADASHELKTPLAIMRGTLEQGLAKCDDDARAQEVFSQLLEQTGRQGAILESLLLLSRADAGKLSISKERIDLSASVETWLEDAGLLAESRDIEIRSDIASDIEIEGDPVLLQRVAHNLFANAVRYNREGGEIECRLWRDGDRIRWTVANTGEPIAAADRERIFDRFEKGTSPADESREVGAGLGLSLVREIVTAHGGQVRVVDSGEGLNVVEVAFDSINGALS